MKLITTTTEVFKFDELTESAKDKAVENLSDINVDSEFWFDYDGKTGFSQYEITMMQKNGLPVGHNIPDELIEHSKIYFDIDRGSFIKLVNPVLSDSEVARCFCGISKRIWSLLDHNFYVTSGRNGDTRIEFTYCGNHEFKAVNDAIDQATERINDKIQQVLTDLRANYEYQTSREAIVETIKANDYDFTVDGKLF